MLVLAPESLTGQEQCNSDARSLRGVARRAGVDPALLHHYFDGKEDLFVHTAHLAVDPRKNLEAILAVPTDAIGVTLVRRLLMLWDSPMGQVTIQTLTSNARLASAFGAMMTKIVQELAAIRFPELPQHARDQFIARIQVTMVGLMVTRHLVKLDAIATASHKELARTYGAIIQDILDSGMTDARSPTHRHR
ncbi:TetR/AcrR family transcriptional regulator [Propioniferax innocua]|uniref:TetR family transcriptional regulator n=1 Tax=Propioniferax innocua TaxID=1753 RepID=A0A542ZCI4_9ACTN|nr:TetR/AcrR family transcriptional regulator [Propioniferax innocua]TQL58001.1 TetR family transcriptional regulator [Propioniferax innocua]